MFEVGAQALLLGSFGVRLGFLGARDGRPRMEKVRVRLGRSGRGEAVRVVAQPALAVMLGRVGVDGGHGARSDRQISSRPGKARQRRAWTPVCPAIHVLLATKVVDAR